MFLVFTHKHKCTHTHTLACVNWTSEDLLSVLYLQFAFNSNRVLGIQLNLPKKFNKIHMHFLCNILHRHIMRCGQLLCGGFFVVVFVVKFSFFNLVITLNNCCALRAQAVTRSAFNT